ncbi:MAG: M23 family metallopeptidase [Chloroflexota bacterium]
MRVRHPRYFIVSIALLAASMMSSTTHAQATPDAASHAALRVAFTSLPAGWFVAPTGEYSSDMLALVRTTGGHSDPVLGIGSLGVRDTGDEAAAVNAVADANVAKETQGNTAVVTRTPTRVGGSYAMMLQGLPGPPNVQIVVAHGGAVYNIAVLGSTSLPPDAQQALARLRFIPRSGPFPAANPPTPVAPRGSADWRPVPRAQATGQSGGASPSTINGNVSMYVFWGQSVNAGCGSHGGALADNCGGYFYGEGDHTGQDYYAIDWPLYAGNSIFPQTPSPVITYAGQTTNDAYWGYGKWVVLSEGYGVVSYYAHLKDILVSAGGHADWSYAVGHSGCTGNCYGAHTHVAWTENPNWDSGRPYNGTPEPQSPLYTFSVNYPVYNSLYKGEIVNGW